MPLAFLHKPIYEHRIEVLSRVISEQLQEGDRVLDVGSGFGALGARLRATAESKGQTIEVEGIEKHPRGGEAIHTLSFDGYQIPCADDAYDVTILADVVHHEEDFMRLLKEVARVTKRIMIIKDHTANGFLGYQRICFMDWAANSPYGVKCLYRYFSAAEWRAIYQKLGGSVAVELESIKLYQGPVNVIFGNKLQYLAVVAMDAGAASGAE
jgi:ubiquinone/menaquinone biosynthesis C-methylase UbiE